MKNLVYSIVKNAAMSIMTLTCSLASAATFPSGPIKIVVPFSPGGVTDVIARLYAEKVRMALQVPAVVENRPGANQIIATQTVALSPADGQTVLLVTGAFLANPYTQAKSPYSVFGDFQGLAMIGQAPAVLVVNSGRSIKTVQQFVEKAKTENLSYASFGDGSMPHIFGSLLSKLTNIELLQVPYKGESPATFDLLANRIDAGFLSPLAADPYIQTGKLSALAINGTARLPTMPNVPTFKEAGVNGFETIGFIGFVVRKDTPDAAFKKLATAFESASADPEIRKYTEKSGMQPMAGGAPEFQKFLKGQDEAWRKAIQTAGIHPQ
jgi:tripartite-type tricarboxylate transporter receptor subunit TctC